MVGSITNDGQFDIGRCPDRPFLTLFKFLSIRSPSRSKRGLPLHMYSTSSFVYLIDFSIIIKNLGTKVMQKIETTKQINKK